MAVETTETRIEYLGDGAATEFSFPFPVLEKSHLAVAAATDDGTDAGYAEGADYTVALSASALGEAYAAVVTLAQPLPAGWTLTIARGVPLTQQTRLRNHEGFFPEAVEKSLDKLTMIDQQQQGLIDRALKAPPGSVPEELLESLMEAGERIDGVESAVAGLNSVKADKTELAAETTARQQADAALTAAKADKTALAAETTARISGDDSLSSSLAAETTARQNADSALAASKADKTDLAAETTARQNADAALTTAVAATYATKTEVSTGLAGKAGLTHAPQHAAAGADPITPAAIGAAASDDARLTDARTPTAHKATHATGGSDAITPASIGAVATNDSRLSDARTPTAHASTHVGGTDAIAAATTTTAGLMAAADKSKLDGLEQVDPLPAVEANTVLGADADDDDWTPKTGAEVAAMLPKGGASAFGVVKVDGTTITASGGVLSAVGGGGGGDGTSDHRALTNRDAEGQHPTSAIVHGEDEEALDEVLDAMAEAIDDKAASDDSRLSDAREPTAHVSTHAAAGSDALTPAAIGAVASDDSRLSDARTPTAHKTSHAVSGSDALTPGDIGAVASGDSRLSDARTPTAHASTHLTGGTDAIAEATTSAAGLMSAADKTALDAKAPIASPTLTGTPTAPTATAGTSTTQIATTAFVQSAIGGIALQDTITGDGVKTTWIIEHDKNSTRVFVQTFSVATGRQVWMEPEITDANTITLTVPEPLPDEYEVTVNILVF